MSKRKNYILALSVGFVTCLATAFTALSAISTSAEETVNYSMVSGAEIRIDEVEEGTPNYSGIRFTFSVDQTYYDALENKEMGMYIAFASVATEAQMQVAETALDLAKWHVVADENLTAENGKYEMKAVIYNVPDTAFGTQLIANGYVTEGKGTETEKTYLASNPQIRSIAQAASIALASGNTTAGLTDYVDEVVTEDNFKFENTAISTDLYKTAELDLGVTLPENVQTIWTSSDEDVATVDENGNVVRGTKLGTTTITAKLGTKTQSATVTVDKPMALKIDGEEDGAKVVGANGYNYVYVAADSEEISSFKGEYAGAALETDSAGSGIHKLYSEYTVEELNKIANDYNKVTFWFALGGGENKEGSTGFIRHYKNDSTVETLALGLTANKDYYITDGEQWMKWTLSINDYISLLTAEVKDEVATGKYYVSLYQAWAYNFKVNPNMYIGNVEFVLDPYIVKVDESATSKITYGGSTTSFTYVANEENSVISGFTGDYEGNAVYKLDPRYSDYRVAIPYTLTEFEMITSKYTSVSMWVAMDNIATNTYMIHANSTASCFLNKVYLNDKTAISSFSETTNGVWKKFTISVDDFVSLCTTTTTDETTGETITTLKEYFLFANASVSGSLTSKEDRNNDGVCDYKDVALYVGDIFFE